MLPHININDILSAHHFLFWVLELLFSILLTTFFACSSAKKVCNLLTDSDFGIVIFHLLFKERNENESIQFTLGVFHFFIKNKRRRNMRFFCPKRAEIVFDVSGEISRIFIIRRDKPVLSDRPHYIKYIVLFSNRLFGRILDRGVGSILPLPGKRG